MTHRAAAPGLAPAGRPRAALRFATELVAWIATPWALWDYSVSWACASIVLLISLPAVFTTRGDKVNVGVPVPGVVTIGLNVVVFAAALVSAWIAWPVIAALAVTLLVAVASLAQLPRWRWLSTAET